MSKKRGLSLEDKRSTILSIYHDSKEPMNLKEIEAKASKAGVVQQTIKDVNQSLVDDDLVHNDKIGAAVFFWSFPAEAFVKKQSEKENLLSQIASTKECIVEFNDKIKRAKISRSDPERAPKIKKYYEFQDEDKKLSKILEDNRKNDPVEIKNVLDLAAIVKKSANRWTDNIWSLKDYMKKKKGVSGNDADKMLGIEGDFDYVEHLPEKMKMK
jgi:hypothetical protein